jgi:UDP-N-acetylglucosamine--N-acetylmuramyl-(pentapeptide) pyrophosphoryl-undecaprenol N-acetylglucosamine transferase
MLIIAAGGTGGHLYPAVALAREFLAREPGGAVRFVGTTRGLERQVVPREGFALDLITAKPLMGLGVAKAVRALAALPVGIAQSVSLLRRHRAGLVIGIGGYTSPPVLLAAWLLRIPRAILEPNAHPGMANRAVAPFVDRIFLAFAEAGARFRAAKVRVVGTPVRRAFMTAAAGEPPSGLRRLLVFGGSQGAQAINAAMVDALPRLAAIDGLTIVHQTGEKDHAQVQAAYATAGLSARAQVLPFIYDMPEQIRKADVVVSRSGAVTVAELTAVGKPAVLVPLPQAIYNHQAKNAAVLEQAGAAIVVPQDRLTGGSLGEAIVSLSKEPARLQTMAARSRALGRTDSAERIIDECLALVRRGPGEATAGG